MHAFIGPGEPVSITALRVHAVHPTRGGREHDRAAFQLQAIVGPYRSLCGF